MLIEKIDVSKLKKDIVVPSALLNDEQRPRVRISSMGHDLQWQYKDIMQGAHEPDDRLKMIFATGHIMEQAIFAILDEHITGKDQKVYTGIIDHLGNEVKGEIDCLYDCPDTGRWVVDVKTMSQYSFEKLVGDMDVETTHFTYYVQLQLYMHFLGIPQGFILAYNKNTSEFAEVPVLYDEIFAYEHIARMTHLIDMLKNGVEPELEYPARVFIKSNKVRNKSEYVLTGAVWDIPDPKNAYNPWIDTEKHVYEINGLKGMKFSGHRPDFEDLDSFSKERIIEFIESKRGEREALRASREDS